MLFFTFPPPNERGLFMSDAFARRHGAVNFIFFALAVVLTVVLLHPVYQAVSLFCAALYYALLQGRKSIKVLLGLLPLWMLLSAVNPLFDPLGRTVLFTYWGRPYTYEALVYGMVLAAMCVAVLLWFLCYALVMTTDKFTALFAPLLPALSLLLVMIFRLIPSYGRKAQQIRSARMCIGLGGENSRKAKLQSGIATLSALTTWALEGSIVTADSMRARGYGAAKRTRFQVSYFTPSDGILLGIFALLIGGVICAAAKGCTQAAYIPAFFSAPVASPLALLGVFCWGSFLLIPSLEQIWEAVKWHSFRSGI